MSDDAFFQEIQDGFLQEAADLLVKVESLSLALEKSPDSVETYAELARLAHNFKGSGKAVGFDHISKLGHSLEDFILAIKNKTVASSPSNLDFLFKCLDCLKTDIEKLIADKTVVINHDDLHEEITRRLNHQDSPQATEEVQSKTEEPAEIDFSAAQTETPEVVAEDKPKMAAVIQIETKSPKSNQPEVLRIQKSKVDFLLETFGEQVILQSTLEQCKFDLEKNWDLVNQTISQLSKLTFELQSHALSLTMVQISPTFTKLERAIRDAGRTCNKTIHVELVGGDTEVDKILIESLSDSLTHMVRNSVDHAIEDSETRLQKGKPEVGTVVIAAKRVGGQLWIEVKDDGKGLNPQVLVNKAIEKGILTLQQAEKMTTQDKYRLIFANGFSTKQAVSEVSGRGVGMNVVELAVKENKGTIDIESEIDKGTKFTLKLPLSLAIFNGAVIVVNETRFVVPNSEISEISQIKLNEQVQMSQTKSAIKIRDEVYQLIDLRKTLKSSATKRKTESSPVEEEMPVLLTRKLGNKAFIIDEILGVQKIVQKSLGEEVKARPEYAAATILSDGTPSVILNLGALSDVA